MKIECPMVIKCLPDHPTCVTCRGLCLSPLAERPIVYTDTLNGQQALRDDLWAISTGELNSLESERATLKAEVARLSGKTGFCAQCEAYAKEIEAWKREHSQACDIVKQARENLIKDRDRWRGIAEKIADAAGAITESIAFTVGTKTNSEMPKWLLARGEDLKKALSLYDEAVK